MEKPLTAKKWFAKSNSDAICAVIKTCFYMNVIQMEEYFKLYDYLEERK